MIVRLRKVLRGLVTAFVNWNFCLNWWHCFRFLLLVKLVTSNAFITERLVANVANDDENDYLKITVANYKHKVYASWLGQMVGNFYGLPHENAYIDDPGPEAFPFGYTTGMMEQLRQYNGAFSDDDTDIEYLYLLQMEKYGPEPTYEQLAAAWVHHIRERVWLANRAALGLMHYGITPPLTGQKATNPHWFQIDPQLINEIWAVTAPGMIDYAVEKSEWAARITNDDWGVEPTMHYGAMFAAAFFEADVYKLIDIGTAALPEGSRFAKTVEGMKALYRKYPYDWQAARKEMAEKYYHNEPLDTKTIWNANLNGACGILALLYGAGDFQNTLDMAVVMGFDADNQTATMCGLLGLIHGVEGIPKELLLPITGWTEPFNDSYINVSRHDMPDASIKAMAERTALLGEKIITMSGGKKITENGIDCYMIRKHATFTPPLELPNGPDLSCEAGKPVNLRLPVIGCQRDMQWKIVEGELPDGLRLDNGTIRGIAKKVGLYSLKIEVIQGGETVSNVYNLAVKGRNLAHEATRVLTNVERTDIASRDSLWLTVPYSSYADDIEVIRDGKVSGSGSTFYSISGVNTPKEDYYGYEWDNPVTVDLLSYHTGAMEEIAGWFISLNVEYKSERGEWLPVENLVISPLLIAGNHPYNKPHFVEYKLSFKSVQSAAIRMIGKAGGGEHWYSKPAYFTSISELGVYRLGN